MQGIWRSTGAPPLNISSSYSGNEIVYLACMCNPEDSVSNICSESNTLAFKSMHLASLLSDKWDISHATVHGMGLVLPVFFTFEVSNHPLKALVSH